MTEVSVLSAPRPQSTSTYLLWLRLLEAAKETARKAPFLTPLLSPLLQDTPTLEEALAVLLGKAQLDGMNTIPLLRESYTRFPTLAPQALRDLEAILTRDPAATDPLTPFLYFKGFKAIETHRVAHALYHSGSQETAFYLQSRSSEIYGTDIHPNALLGEGIMMDHATGIVIGETAVVEDGVSLLHGVTLGGTGKERGDRHPKIRRGATLGAGATLLGNIEIGENAKIGAGSIVLQNVPPGATAVGAPARIYFPNQKREGKNPSPLLL